MFQMGPCVQTLVASCTMDKSPSIFLRLPKVYSHIFCNMFDEHPIFNGWKIFTGKPARVLSSQRLPGAKGEGPLGFLGRLFGDRGWPKRWPPSSKGFLSHGRTPLSLAGWFMSRTILSRNGWWLGVPPFQKSPYSPTWPRCQGAPLCGRMEQIGIPFTRLKRDPSAALTSYSAEIRLSGQIWLVLHDQHPEVYILVFCYGNADFPRHCSPKSDDRAFFFRGLLMKWSWVETTRLVTRRWPISMLKGDIQFGKTMGVDRCLYLDLPVYT